MSYFLIIRGPLGSGKTTIATGLSDRLGAEHVKVDEILEQNNLDHIPEGAPCIPLENFMKANELVRSDVRQALESGKPVIFDACFYHKEVIEDLIQSLSFPHYVFTLKAPLTICIERDSKRKKSHGEGAAQAVHNLVSAFDYGTMIDVTKTLDETVEEILSHIDTNS